MKDKEIEKRVLILLLRNSYIQQRRKIDYLENKINALYKVKIYKNREGSLNLRVIDNITDNLNYVFENMQNLCRI